MYTCGATLKTQWGMQHVRAHPCYFAQRTLCQAAAQAAENAGEPPSALCRHQQDPCRRLGAACGPAALHRPRLGGAAAEAAEHAAHVLLGDRGAGRLAAQRRQDVVGEVAHAGRQRSGLPSTTACRSVLSL